MIVKFVIAKWETQKIKLFKGVHGVGVMTLEELLYNVVEVEW